MSKRNAMQARIDLEAASKLNPRIATTNRLRDEIHKFVREVFAPASQALGHEDAKFLLESLLNNAINGGQAKPQSKVRFDG